MTDREPNAIGPVVSLSRGDREISNDAYRFSVTGRKCGTECSNARRSAFLERTDLPASSDVLGINVVRLVRDADPVPSIASRLTQIDGQPSADRTLTILNRKKEHSSPIENIFNPPLAARISRKGIMRGIAFNLQFNGPTPQTVPIDIQIRFSPTAP